MAHLPLEELVKKINDAGREVLVGARYVHYKDPEKEYIVKSLALLEATDEVACEFTFEAEHSIQWRNGNIRAFVRERAQKN